MSDLDWTREDSAAATAEGWDIFDNSDYGEEIERIDCPEDGSDPLFESDDAAFAFVLYHAGLGSTLHVKALVIYEQTLRGSIT